MSASDPRVYYAQTRERSLQLKSAAPAIATGFANFYQSQMKPGEISVREKELIALGIALTMRCEGCIYAHARGCIKSGATRQQVLEAAGVAVMMQGGPAYTYMHELIDALDAIEQEDAVT